MTLSAQRQIRSSAILLIFFIWKFRRSSRSGCCSRKLELLGTVNHFCLQQLLLNSIRCVCSVSPLHHSSGANTFQLWSMSVLPLAVAVWRFYSIAAPAIRSPPQQTRKASIFAGWLSTMQQVSTTQIVQDMKSDTDTTLKYLNFRIKQYHTQRQYVRRQVWGRQIRGCFRGHGHTWFCDYHNIS